ILDQYVYFYPKNDLPSLDIPHAEFPENEIIAVLGNNGAGKSTFGDALCGLIRMKNAKCRYKGKEYRSQKMRTIAYKIFQDVNNQLFCESILKEMSLGISKKIQKTDSHKDTVKRVLEIFNLYKKRKEHPMSLSGGEKQRTAIATAIVQNKEIFVFDEPTSGLDLRNMKAVCEVLNNLKERGKSVFVITHDPELVFRCCTYVVFLKDSQIQWMSYMNSESVEKLEKFFSV
nr:ATP-binding cassette domain-containing protein [Acetatifactor sp.]